MNSDFNSTQYFLCYRPSKFGLARSPMTQGPNHIEYKFFCQGKKSTGRHTSCLISSQFWSSLCHARVSKRECVMLTEYSTFQNIFFNITFYLTKCCKVSRFSTCCIEFESQASVVHMERKWKWQSWQ